MMACTSPARTLEVDAAQDLLASDRGVQRSLGCCSISPTLPSRLTPRSFCASTANSIGSSSNTSRQKPFTIIEIASSSAEAALPAVEQLVLADLRGRRLVLDLRGRVLHLDVGEGVRAALVAEQQRVALRVVARAGRADRSIFTRPAVGVLAAAGGDALGQDRAAGVLADVDHLGAGVGLLAVGGERHRVELADRVVALQDDARVLPGDGRAGLDLGPGDLRVAAAHWPRLVTKL